MSIHFARVLWFNSAQGFGVAGLLKDGSTMGIHRDRGRFLYQGTGSLELRLEGRRLTQNQDPKEKETICLIAGGKSRKGNPYAEVWALGSDWDTAGIQIQERYLKLEYFLRNPERGLIELREAAAHAAKATRLRWYPKLRLIEQRHVENKPESPARIIFEGTLDELRYLTHPPTYSSKRPLITTTSNNTSGYKYVRWFQRETWDGWQDCADPETLGLVATDAPEWSFEETALTLRSAQIKRAPRGMIGVGFQWWLEGKVIAQGNNEKVTVLENTDHCQTTFLGGDAEYLWEHSDRSDLSAIPDANRYSSSRRGDKKAAYDLAQLGRSVNEWEKIR